MGNTFMQTDFNTLHSLKGHKQWQYKGYIFSQRKQVARAVVTVDFV